MHHEAETHDTPLRELSEVLLVLELGTIPQLPVLEADVMGVEKGASARSAQIAVTPARRRIERTTSRNSVGSRSRVGSQPHTNPVVVRRDGARSS